MGKMHKRAAWVGFAAAVIGLGTVPAGAAAINYGTFVGTDVSFIGVTESSGTDAVPLYQAPTAVGNALDFDPMTFVSFSVAGSADITDGQLNFFIQAHPGKGIDTVSVSELGDYTLIGSGGAGTSASVGQVFFIKVLEVDNVPLTAAQQSTLSFTANTVFSPSGGTFNMADEGQVSAAPWSGSFSKNIGAAVLASGLGQYATRVAVVSNNTLGTTSETGTASFIAKKDVVFSTTIVPEPASLGLLGGIALLAMRRRRA